MSTNGDELLHALTKAVEEYQLLTDRIANRAVAREMKYLRRVEGDDNYEHPEHRSLLAARKSLNQALADAEMHLYGRTHRDEGNRVREEDQDRGRTWLRRRRQGGDG